MGTIQEQKAWGGELDAVLNDACTDKPNGLGGWEDGLLATARHVLTNAELWAERLGVVLPIKVVHSPFNCDDCPENLVDPDLDDADGPAFLDELIAVPQFDTADAGAARYLGAVLGTAIAAYQRELGG